MGAGGGVIRIPIVYQVVKQKQTFSAFPVRIFDQNKFKICPYNKKSFQKSPDDIILRFNPFCFHFSVSSANKRQYDKALFCHFIYLNVIMSNLSLAVISFQVRAYPNL